MTSSSEQPPYEMMDAYILTKEDWLKLREHLTIGCTNQKAFLDTLRPPPAHPPEAQQRINDTIAEVCKALRELSSRIGKYKVHEVQAIGLMAAMHGEIIKMTNEYIALLQAGRK